MTFLHKYLQLLSFLLCIQTSFALSDQTLILNEQNFIQNIWQEIQSTGIEDKIINTLFMKGIKDGTLDPLCYGRFTAQDIPYMTVSAKLWDQACQDGKNDIEFVKFCEIHSAAEHKFQNFLKNGMYLYSVQPMNEMKNYINQKVKKYLQHTYHYITIVNYVCYKLYASMNQKIISEAKKDSPYFSWIQHNSSGYFIPGLQAKINQYQRYFNRDEVKNDLISFMMHELDYFTASCPVSENIDLSQ